MRFFYCTNSNKVNEISQNGINADKDGLIPVIVLDERFLMYQYVVEAYAYEMLEIDEFCFFEISPKAVTGNVDDLKTNNLLAPFFKLLRQDRIDKQFLTPQATDRYDSMGFDIGVFLVENKQNFNETYKKKILEYAKLSM